MAYHGRPQDFNAEEPSPGFQSPDFSAVLQAIFQQAQVEIEARDRNLNSRYDSSVAQSLRHDDIYGRHEPLDDPVLSYISSLLAEDDDAAVSGPVEFDAYHAKASEMAALLSEDSPSLDLNVEGQTSLSPEDLGQPAELISEADLTDRHSYLDLEQTFLMKSFPAPVRNELLLNSLRGSPPRVSKAAHPLHLSEAGNVGNGPLHRISAQETEAQVSRSLDRNAINSEVFTNEKLNRFEHSSRNLVDRTSHMQAGCLDEIGCRFQSQKPFNLPEKRLQSLKRRKKGSSSLKKRVARAKSSKETDKECVELNDVLLQCAQAVGLNNTKRAVEMLNKAKQHACPYGSGAERLAHYFSVAMEARFSGTGWPLYKGLLGRHPSSAEILKATYLYMASCPFVKAYHYFINQTILNAAGGASKLHILELQVDGFQYPALFKALASRPEGPPQVHLIGLGFPHYSTPPAQTESLRDAVHNTGRQLSDYAASCGVPFKFTPWAGRREDLRMQDFVRPYREAGEVLVIISASLLRYVMDDTLDSPALRLGHMKQGRDLNPDVYIQGVVTGSYSTPFFTRRFKEALFHFESVFDMLDTCIKRESSDRLVFEGEILGKAILNIVACEGTEVMDRIDKYKNWQAVTEEVGFKQLPLDKQIKDNVQLMLKSWHKEYTVAEDSQYLLMGWKGRMLHAMSTWNAVPEEPV